MRKLLLAIATIALGAAFLAAQEGPNVSLSQGPPITPYQVVYGYTSTNLIYACYSPSERTTGYRQETKVSIASATNGSPVVFTSTAHGFNTNSRPTVTISGATGNWTPVNGTFTATITSVNAFSIPVDSTGFSTLTGTLVFTTTAPRQNQPEWAVVEYTYDGSNNLTTKLWLNGSTGMQAKCSDATVSTTNIQ